MVIDFRRLNAITIKNRYPLIRDARAASAVAMESERVAREATSTALAKEERLAKQLELLDKRADNAISVAEADALEAEVLEDALSVLPAGSANPGPELSLSPYTWMDGSSIGLDASHFFSNFPGAFGFDPFSSGPPDERIANPASPSGGEAA